MRDLAVAVYQLPEWLTVRRLHFECAERTRDVVLPLEPGAALPPIECSTTITIDFRPERE